MSSVRIPMMNRDEDKPLLVSVARGFSKGSDDESYSKNKYGRSGGFKKYPQPGKDDGRARYMIQGASAVMKKWPDNLALCWIAAVVVCFIIIVFVLTFESTFRSPPHMYTFKSLHEKCKQRLAHKMKEMQENPGITNVYLHVILNEGESFKMSKYNSIMKGVEEHHPNHIINVLVLYNDTFELDYKRNVRFKDWELFHNQQDKMKFFDTSSVEEDIIKPRDVKVIEEVEHKNLKLIRSTFSSYFRHSPLRYRWRIIMPEMIPFVFRVLTVWEHGGISMPWQLFLEKTEKFNHHKKTDERLKNVVNDLKKAYVPKDGRDTPEIRAKKQLIEEIQSYVDIVGDHYNNTQPGIVEPHLKPNRTKIQEKKPAKILKEHVRAEVPRKKVSGSSSKSKVSEEPVPPKRVVNNTSEAKIILKKQKNHSKEVHEPVAFVPNKKLVHRPNSDFYLPSDSEVIDREIKKLSKVTKPPVKADLKNILESESKSPEKPRTRRVRRDLRPVSNPGKTDDSGFHPTNEVFYPHNSSEYVSSEYSDSDYYDEHYPGPVKTNRGQPKFHLSTSSYSSSSYTRSSSLSHEDHESHDSSESFGSRNHFQESKAYVKRKVFDNVNVFSYPSKVNVVMDKFGYYFSTKRPCHVYLGQLISLLQSNYDLISPENIISEGLRSFCRGRKFNDCEGVLLL